MTNDPPRHIIITGLPHFVARLVADEIAETEPTASVTALVRADRIDRVRSELRNPSTIEIVPARIVLPDLGLADAHRLDLIEHVTDIYHFESLYHLGVDARQVEDVNVLGTRHLLEIARRAPNLRRFNHYSTAFVAGDRAGIVLESELDRGQRFRTPYERTRFAAELLVRRAAGTIPITIYRPSLVVGESTTGDMGTVDGPYFLLQLLTHTPGRLPRRVPSAQNAPFNVVPADYVARSITALSRMPHSVGETYHLVDPSPLRNRDALELIAQTANLGPAPSRLRSSLRSRVLELPIIERYVKRSQAYLHELDGATWFNASNAIRDLSSTGIFCPSFADYVDKLVAAELFGAGSGSSGRPLSRSAAPRAR